MMRIVLFMAVLAASAGNAFAQDAARGKQVYTDSKCSVCHSVGAVGNKKGPLDAVGSKLTTADTRQWITNAPEMAAKAKADRKPAMKAYPNLTKEEVDSLVAYLQTLK